MNRLTLIEAHLAKILTALAFTTATPLACGADKPAIKLSLGDQVVQNSREFKVRPILQPGKERSVPIDAWRVQKIEDHRVLICAQSLGIAAWTSADQVIRIDRAIADLKKFIGLDPLDASAWDLLAQIQASSPEDNLRSGNQAVDAASKACELTEWKKPAYLNTLASAYAEADDFESAVKWQTKAIALEADAKQKEEYHARRKLFQEKQPYRDAKL